LPHAAVRMEWVGRTFEFAKPGSTARVAFCFGCRWVVTRFLRASAHARGGGAPVKWQCPVRSRLISSLDVRLRRRTSGEHPHLRRAATGQQRQTFARGGSRAWLNTNPLDWYGPSLPRKDAARVRESTINLTADSMQVCWTLKSPMRSAWASTTMNRAGRSALLRIHAFSP
jgi:hypothetical protein